MRCQFFFKRKLVFEFTDANIGQLHAIKLRRGTDKNVLSRLSHRAPLNSFIILYYVLKLKAK